VIDPSDQLGTASRFLTVRCSYGRVRKLHYWQGRFWLWANGHYQKAEDEMMIRTGLYRFLAGAEVELKGRGSSGGFGRLHPNRGMVNNLIDALKAEAFLEAEVEMPSWLGDACPVEKPCELVAMQNGLFYLPTRKLFGPSPKFWSANVLEFGYDPEARAPRFEQFLEEIWPGDEEAQQTLLEMFLLCLTDVTRCQKAFMFVGPPRGGRGTIGRVLRGLIGEENYVGATFYDFKETFGLEAWIGKKVAVFSDASLDGVYKREQGLIAERLKNITGEDKLSVRQKNTKNWNGMLRTRMLMFSNEIMHFRDDSGALVERFITWRMKQSFVGREDRNLTAKLLAERPGIFNLALDALDRLRERGWQFLQPANGVEMVEDLSDLASPIRVFVKDHCEIGMPNSVKLETLFLKRRSWAAQHNQWPSSEEEFSKKLRAAFHHIDSDRPRTFNDKPNLGRKTVLRGIGLRKG
jgi:putative DNA primase/helicase